MSSPDFKASGVPQGEQVNGLNGEDGLRHARVTANQATFRSSLGKNGVGAGWTPISLLAFCFVGMTDLWVQE